MTVTDLTKRWQCSPGHVTNLIKRGELPATNIGCGSKPRYFVSDDAVAEFEGRRAVQPPVAKPKRHPKRRTDIVEIY